MASLRRLKLGPVMTPSDWPVQDQHGTTRPEENNRTIMENSRQQQQPSHDEIARMAYQLWEQRGHPQGFDVELWLEAERQIASRGKQAETELPVPARTPDTLALQVQPGPPAQSASQVRTRSGQGAATKVEGGVKHGTPRTTIPSARQTKPAASPARP